DLFKPYGHRHLQYSQQAIPAMGECLSNWEAQKLIAAALGYEEPWLRQSSEEIIGEVLDATRAKNSRLTAITMERLQREGTVPYHFGPGEEVPFADLRFPTPSGKVELYSETLAAEGLDPLPDHVEPFELADLRRDSMSNNGSASNGRAESEPLVLLSG